MATPPVFVAGSVLLASELNQIGLWRVKAETSFSAASSVTADNVFTSDFTNYRMLIRYQTSTTGAISMKMRVGGVSASTNYNTQDLLASGTSLSGARLTAQTSAQIGVYTNGAFPSFITIDLSGPNLAENTQFTSVDSHNLGAFTSIRYATTIGNHSTATAYDGIELLVASGNMTGTYTIYGYRK
jgi:hypothetical protein